MLCRVLLDGLCKYSANLHHCYLQEGIKLNVSHVRKQERGVLSLWSGLLPRSLRIIGAVFILGEAKKRLEAGYLSMTTSQDAPGLKAIL
jgi:hypothetical protein